MPLGNQEMQDDDLVQIASFAYRHEAEYAVSVLEAAGIDAIIRDGFSQGCVRTCCLPRAACRSLCERVKPTRQERFSSRLPTRPTATRQASSALFEQLRTAIRSLNETAPRHRRLIVSTDGVMLESAKSQRVLWQVAWSDLDEIVAFKIDAITMDHVCLGFRLRGATVFHVTDEETPGWIDLCQAIDEKFRLEPKDWFSEVAFPAFVENRTVLWRAS